MNHKYTITEALAVVVDQIDGDDPNTDAYAGLMDPLRQLLEDLMQAEEGPISTIDLAKIVQDNLDRIRVFSPYSSSLDAAESVCINGECVQIDLPRPQMVKPEMGDDAFTRTEYLASIDGDAKSLLEEVIAEKEGEIEDPDDLREALEERLAETCDGHSWAIYTYKAQKVLAFSHNDDYAIVNIGIESAVSEGGINWSALAAGALYADMGERLWVRFEEWTEEWQEITEEGGEA